MCHEDIAQRMGVTRRVVKRDMARAYAALRTRLDTDLVGSNDARPFPDEAL
jgi:DNA-directed RNA polymerase specialized sigma24 family protein